MATSIALQSGAAGALALTAAHESLRRLIPLAPRVDLVGMRAIARPMEAFGAQPPAETRLHRLALIGDLVSNSLYYSLIGAGQAGRPWRRGAILGLAAGAAAVLLTPALGLGRAEVRRTRTTALMTLGYYLLGGLVAAGTFRALRHRTGELSPCRESALDC
ncbi:MAG: hypothetical protein AMXMBFR13_23400 [Phycisphaerae bacterium]